MQQHEIKLTVKELETLGITQMEIAEAGGIEVLRHIVWFLQNTEDFTDEDVERAMASAAEKKAQETMLKQAFSSLEAEDISDDKTFEIKEEPTQALASNGNRLALSLIHNPKKIPETEPDENQTIEQIYKKACTKNKHPALKMMLEAYFILDKDHIPTAQERKSIFKTIALLRAFIAGSPLPLDAEAEKLIAQARLMYKEFLEDKNDYNHCPITFLLDEDADKVPEKYRIITQALPISAILKLFSELCFYDPENGTVEEPLPEEIDIKNLCEMIETLATICKIWQ